MRVKMRSMGPSTARRAGTIAADVRQNDDERGLAHVGALAAHVRAGDDQHAARVVEAQVVGDEGFAAGAFDHRMASAVDPQHRLLDQFRLRAIERRGALGETVEHVDLRNRGRGRLQRRQARGQVIQQCLVQLPSRARAPDRALPGPCPRRISVRA